MLVHHTFSSPIGPLKLQASDQGIVRLDFTQNQDKTTTTRVDHPHLQTCIQQLEEYFASLRQSFDVSLDLPYGTEFQRKVWQALQAIPYGAVVSYQHIAQTIGHPKAARAVGGANHHNPIAIIIPCHRVIGASGKLVGYAGGMPIKQALLALEKPSPTG